jgi:hypothetical protein
LFALIDYLERYQDDTEEEMSNYLELIKEKISQLSKSD